MDGGCLGVGNMGQPMAEKLLDAGHTLTMYDLGEAAMRRRWVRRLHGSE